MNGRRMLNEPATKLGGSEREYHYVACYYQEGEGKRYSAIGHGWIIRGPNYVGCQGWRTIGEAVADCATWDETGTVMTRTKQTAPSGQG